MFAVFDFQQLRSTSLDLVLHTDLFGFSCYFVVLDGFRFSFQLFLQVCLHCFCILSEKTIPKPPNGSSKALHTGRGVEPQTLKI